MIKRFLGGSMITSRRVFLRFGAGAAATAASWPLKAVAAPPRFEPSRSGSSDGLIYLYSNENAYGASPKVADALRAAVESANRYPRLHYHDVIEQIAAVHHVAPEHVLLGCGSTEILRTAAFAFAAHGKQLIHASPTFEAIEHYSQTVNAKITAVPLTSGFAHDLDAMLARANEGSGLVYICNPNNPTASLTTRSDLENFIAKLPSSAIVLIDEAYHHYAGASGMYASFLDRPIDDEKVIVARTFSKVYGLAGMRLGYAIASPKIVQQMRIFSNEDNINAMVTQAASVALNDTDSTRDFIQRNANDRQEFFNQAMARALKPIDSHTNFVMMNTFHPAEKVIQHFRKNNIMIGRRFPAMDTHIRVSLGRPEEMLAFWRVWDLLPFSKNIMHH